MHFFFQQIPSLMENFDCKFIRSKALPSAMWLTTTSTSYIVIGFIKEVLCSSVSKEGMCWVTLSIAITCEGRGSVRTILKNIVSSPSLYVFSSRIIPCSDLILVILFLILCWTVDWWKKIVFLSPTFNHPTLDFCLRRISFCSYLLSNWSKRYFYLNLISFVYPWFMIESFILSISSCITFLSLNILPKVVWFHWRRFFFKKHRILMHDRHLGSTFDLHVGPLATDCIKEGGVREP